MTDISNIEKTRQLLRQMQTLMFDPNIEKKDLFPLTLDMEKLLNESVIEINKIKNN